MTDHQTFIHHQAPSKLLSLASWYLPALLRKTQHSINVQGLGARIPLFEGTTCSGETPWLLFSRYEFLQRVGEGAYGSVWRCQDKVTGEIVACKKLKDVAQSEEVSFTIL